MAVRSLLSVSKFVEKHPFIGKTKLRRLIGQRSCNGFSRVVTRCGKKFLIDEELFFEWLETENR